jgi:hypothetical protein
MEGGGLKVDSIEVGGRKGGFSRYSFVLLLVNRHEVLMRPAKGYL